MQYVAVLTGGAFKPFRAAIDAGVKVMMTAHVALPKLTGREDVPATLQKELMTDLLRRRGGSRTVPTDGLDFPGLLISDAMDMEAISQGAGQIVDAIAALRRYHPRVEEIITGNPPTEQEIAALREKVQLWHPTAFHARPGSSTLGPDSYPWALTGNNPGPVALGHGLSL